MTFLSCMNLRMRMQNAQHGAFVFEALACDINSFLNKKKGLVFSRNEELRIKWSES